MPLESFYTVSIENCFSKDFDHYPTQDEIEQVIKRIFPTGIYSDWNEEIAVKAHVTKFYRVIKEGKTDGSLYGTRNT